MSSLPPNLQRPLQQATDHPWFEKLARLGYAAKGIVYFVIGLLAAQAAIGAGGKTTDPEGALSEIVTQPFGKFLLAIVTLGLIGYALWRYVQAILDPEHRQQNDHQGGKQIIKRIGAGLSAIAYTGLALTAIKLILGSGGNNNSNSTADWTARFLAQPFGQWLVGLGGLITIGVGISFIYQAYKAKFQREFKLQEMSMAERTWAKGLGQFGMAARGVVFWIIGALLIQAALQSDASRAKGLGGALATLAAQPFGPFLLGIIALGLIAYSLYSLIAARYRRFA